MECVAGEEDGAIEFVGETAVTTSDHHGGDDEFGENLELGGEGRVGVWVSEGKTHCAVGGDDFK